MDKEGNIVYKRKYLTPSMDVEIIDDEDVIYASGPGGTGGDGEDGEDDF